MPSKLLNSRHLYLKLPAILLAVLAVACAAAFLWLRTSLPVLSGTVTVQGLQQEAEILYDVNGIPHIRAGSAGDAYFALGYAHAADRLFQMDFMRRLARGRLSEVIGPSTVGLDRSMRTLGLGLLAEETYRRLPPRARAVLEAYSAGVNAGLETRSGALPPEFIALRYRPERWTPPDSLVWGRLMALRLAGNWRTEALRAGLAERLDADRIGDLWPADDGTPPPTLSAALRDTDLAGTVRGLLGALPDQMRQMSASNSWAVAGKLTDTGRPLLANDPHLGYQAPGLWYLARISAPGLEIAGATVAGVPFHILGHTDRFAWAFTTTDSDTQDLFVERLSEGETDRYDTPDGPQPFRTRTEEIAVKGAAPVLLTVRETRHGPVVSDLDPRIGAGLPDGHVLALSAMALRADDMTPLAILDMNRAGDWAEFRAALRNFHAPQQNITFADTDGNIAFLAPGRVPVRKAGDGSVPVPGWTGEHDWTGTVPFEELPQAFNPPAGRIVNANHRVVPDDYPWYLTRDWADPYRARRIFERLEETELQTAATTAALQNDVLSGAAVDLLPVLFGLLRPGGDRERTAADQLRQWDRRMTRAAAEPLVFTAWLAEINRGLYADELGPYFDDYFGLHPRVVLRMLAQRPEWCDDMSTAAAESCEVVVTHALERALDGLERTYGADRERWQWGKAHAATFRHPVFGRIPVLRRFADIRIAADGGPDTVNRAQNRIGNARDPFASVHGPGFRAIYDLSDLSASQFAIATGMSGNPLSRRYDNTTAAWRDGGYLRVAPSRDEALRGALGVLRLAPVR
ncbi:MAG: penicillin acylase family protein [Rhodospirillaceae bacterium]